ncbi:MAG: divalent-cation tolerance protein CutA [Ignavibacteriales bacterium]
MDDILLLYTTWPDADTAERVGRTVVEEGLAACANILGSGVSIYRWKGAVERAPETFMILKTTGKAAPALRDRLVLLHPYDTPGMVALVVEPGASHAPFLSWIASETGSAS